MNFVRVQFSLQNYHSLNFFFFLMWIIFKVFIEFVTILFQYLYNIEYLTLYNIVTIFVTICFGFLVSGHVGS